MTVQQIQAAAAAMAQQMSQLVQAFETSTGCIVHSLPVRPASGQTQTTVEIKVQIP